MDTAGIRDVEDIAEREGVKRSLRSIDSADLVIALFDLSEPLRDEDFEVIEKVKNKPLIVVLNKCDLLPRFDEGEFSSHLTPNALRILKISATKGDGIEELQEAIFTSCLKDWREEREGVVVANSRHKTAIESARIALERAVDALAVNQPFEILALELRDSLDRLGEIVGAVTTEDILNKIFSEFCIGK
jgi:tRNA modification GTPase